METTIRSERGSTRGPRLAVLALAALLLLAFATSSAAADVSNHEFLYRLGGGETPAGRFTSYGVAVDNSSGSSSGDLYLADLANRLLDKYAPAASAASYLCQITGRGEGSTSPSECDAGGPAPGLPAPRGVATDPATGAVYVSVLAADEVQTYEAPASGTYTLSFEGQTTNPIAATASTGTIEAELERLSTIGTGKVVVSEDEAQLLVKFIASLADRNVPQIVGGGVTVATKVEGGPGAVDRFSAAGLYEKQLELGSAEAANLAVSAATGNVLIADESNNRILEWDPTAETTKTFSTGADTPAGSFAAVRGLAVDNDPSSPAYGDVYVSDRNNVVVDRFEPSGAYQCQITGAGSSSTSPSECDTSEPGLPSGPFARKEQFPGSGSGFVGGPEGLAVDPTTGHLYVVEVRPTFEKTVFGERYRPAGFVDEFGPSGAYYSSLSRAGTRELQPAALAISADTGDLFISGSNNPNEIYVFGPDSPVVHTAKATSVGATSATLQGTVNPLGVEVTACRFEYLEVSKYEAEAEEPLAGAKTAPCEVEGGGPVGSGARPVSVHADVALKADTGYAYRIEAENARAASAGEVFIFGPPGAKTDAATELTQSSATLNGTVEPENVATTYQFEWATQKEFEEGAYGHTAPAAPASAGEGSAEISVSQPLSGLQLGSTYHYRLTVANASGTYTAADRSFATLPALFVDAQPAASIGSSSAILQAYVDPLGATLTECRFQYVEAASYQPAAPDPYAAGSSVPCEGALPSGSSPSLVEAKLEGLEPQTEYRFRLTAENANGDLQGAGEPLTTEPAPGSCPNEARRTEQSATFLPQCRAYEQVSPEEKDSAPVEEGGASPSLASSGQRVGFVSRGVFAGTGSNPYAFAHYLAERTPQGWHTVGLEPDPASVGVTQIFTPPEDWYQFSPDLDRAFLVARYASGLNPIYTGYTFFIREPDGRLVKASPTLEAPGHTAVNLKVSGPNEDLSKFLVVTYPGAPPLAPDSLPPEAARAYEIDGFGTPSAAIRLLNVDSEEPGGMETCGGYGLSVSGGFAEPEGLPGFTPNPENNELGYPISADGSHVFFAADSPHDRCHWGVYARIGGTETVELTRPANRQCTTVACLVAPFSDAAFASASADGARAFFFSGGQLTDEATQFDPARLWQETSTNLYLYDSSSPSEPQLVDLSAGDASGQGPQVQALLGVAKDGSRIYFLARGLLTGRPNSLGQRARAGADNVYVYDTETAQTSFIADICDGEEETGTVAGYAPCVGAEAHGDLLGRDAAGKPGRSAGGDDVRASTPDGRFFFFATHAKLTPDDENEAEDTYRYDAATGALARITVGHDREDRNGNAANLAALMEEQDSSGHSALQGFGGEYGDRRVTPDGQSALIFTRRPLQAGDENSKVDIYLWHQGEVSRITTGHSVVPQGHGIISATGNDIAFTTIDELVPGDRDGLRDVYDARVGGGFPPPPLPEPCKVGGSSEACHGPKTEQAPPPNITNGEFPPDELHCHKGFVKRHGRCVKKHHRKRHRKHPHRHRHARLNTGGRK